MSKMDLENVFTYHSPFGNQAERYGMIRAKALELAELVACQCPASREASLALTSIQQSVMWANAAIACNEKPEPAGPSPVLTAPPEAAPEVPAADDPPAEPVPVVLAPAPEGDAAPSNL